MEFRDKYQALEQKFRERVVADNECFGVDSHFLCNIAPQGAVDFVLIAKEPSYNKKAKDPVPKNFCASIEDFILHFCIKEYLCREGETYYLTDLAKGAMSGDDAKIDTGKRYAKWYPLLCEEIKLVASPQSPKIAIGKDVEGFLFEKTLPNFTGSILHYSKNAAKYRKIIPKAHPERYAEFDTTVCWENIEQTVIRVMTEGNISSYIDRTLKRLRNSKLTESRKQLMFTYNVQFESIRKAAGLV